MPDAIHLQHNDTALTAKSRVELLVAEEVIATELHFDSGKTQETAIPGFGMGTVERCLASSGGFTVTREVFRPKDDPSWLAVRLLLENAGREMLSVAALTPLLVEANGLRLGDKPAGQWVYVRQPRYKNDMPASVVLGDESPMVQDATRGTRETGGWDRRAGKEQQYPNVYVSSEVTAVRTKNASAVFGVLPMDRQLVRSRLELTPDRRDLKNLRIDCQCDGQRLSAGEILVSQWVMADLGSDTFQAIQRYAKKLENMIYSTERHQREVRPRPTVWCSWYYYGDAFTQKEAEANLEFLYRSTYFR